MTPPNPISKNPTDLPCAFQSCDMKQTYTYVWPYWGLER